MIYHNSSAFGFSAAESAPISPGAQMPSGFYPVSSLHRHSPASPRLRTVLLPSGEQDSVVIQPGPRLLPEFFKQGMDVARGMVKIAGDKLVFL